MSRAHPLLLLSLLALAGCDDEAEAPPPAKAPAPAQVRASLATLLSTEGTTVLEREGRRTPATAQSPLYGGDALETSEDGAATVQFADGQRLELGAGSRFLLGDREGAVALTLERGIVLSRVGPGARPKGGVALTVLTPFGLTRLGDGERDVTLTVSNDEAHVEVQLGAIELVARNGEVTRVAAGEQVRATAGGVELLGREGAEAKVIALETIEVTVFADGGQPLVRASGAKSFRPVGKKGATLKPGDAVRMKGGAGTLALSGSGTHVSLAPGATLTFGGVTRGPDGEKTALELDQGALGLHLAPGKKSAISLGGLQLEASDGAEATVARTTRGYEVTAKVGDLTVTEGAQRRPLRAGERARYQQGAAEAEVSALARAELVLPSRAGLQVFHSGLAEVALEWAGEAADYRVEVARDAGFAQLLLSGVVHRAWVNVPAPVRGALFWRVRTAAGAEVDHGSARFSREAARRELDRLRNEVPAGSEKTTIFFQDKPPAVTFTYPAEPAAAAYKVAVFRTDALDRPVAERKVSDPRAPLEAGLLSEGSYVWSVTPVDGKGQPLRGGRMNKLDLVYDNSVPALAVSTPRNGDPAHGLVEASGVAPVGTRLSINGKSAPLDEKNRFRVMVAPAGQPPVVIFRTMRSNEPDTFTVRTLRRK